MALNLPEKKHDLHTFDGGIDTDSAPEFMPNSKARYFLNCRVYSFGNVGVVTGIMGNTLISTPLPAGTNQCINSTPDEANGRFFFSVYNSNGFHTIYLYQELTNQVISVFQSQTQSDGIDVLKWNPKNLILHVDIVAGNLYYWCDGLNKAGKFNITKIMDSTPTGYGLSFTADYITAYKQTSPYPPLCTYFTDTTRNNNNLYANLFKFTQRWHYDDGEISNWSDWSAVPLPPNQSYLGITGITNQNNAIQVQVATGNRLVTKIEIAVKVNNNQINSVGEIQVTDFVVCRILDKTELSIPDISLFTWTFYNDGSYSTTDQGKINRLYSYLPRVPLCQSFVRNALTYTGFIEGYDNVPINASVACTFIDLYVPAGTVNSTSNGSFTTSLVKIDRQRQFSGLSIHNRYNPTYLFTVGSDVVKGQVYTIYGRGGGQDLNIGDLILGAAPIPGGENYQYSYTATANDTAQTVAAQIKAFQRGIGRGWPTNPNAISNESTSGGNVSWEYGYLGYLGQNALVWTVSVTQVQVVTLQDDGTSVNIIKYGSVRNYGFVYIDDDGRESLAYTSPTCVLRTPFITEIGLNSNGDFQQPVHTITINHIPPSWAVAWRLVRTPDTPSYIWTLIQQVITYVGLDGDGTYLDLVIGSLPTYNLLHPNSILAYEFTRGDRLRPVLDTGTGNLITPYFDTEILSYQESTTQTVNSNILINGSNIVTPSATVTADQAGFNIVINGNQRLIVDVNVGANTYTLDEPIVADITTTPTTPTTYPNYILIDNRGTIRIAMPVGITIPQNCIVELYTPQPALISDDYRIFNDFQLKFPILNPGTPQATHACNLQNQTANLPGLMTTSNGDAYVRNREYPTNTIFPGTQVVVNRAVDPNFSDFYYSDMTCLGRVYPQDQGLGAKHFGSRVRFSNNYIQDTTVNGLNDFDGLNRKDYDDPYGDIMRTLFREAKLYAFKQLKDAWINVNNTLTTDQSGNALLVSTSELLNLMEYYNYEGGVGNNPESVCYNGDFIYHACPAAGTFVKINTSFVYGRQLTDNIEAISKKFFFDFGAKLLLNAVQQYSLQLFSGIDRQNDETLWTILPYIEYLFNGGFDPNIWNAQQDSVPTGSIGIVVTQPANGNVVWNGTTGDFDVNMNAGFVGNDTFVYKLLLPGSSFSVSKNVCITVAYPPNRPQGYRVRSSTGECQQVPFTPPVMSTININNTTTDFTIAFVQVTLGGLLIFNHTTITPGQILSFPITAGTYSVTVKVLSSTDGGTANLHINSNIFFVPALGLTPTQTGVSTSIIVELDPS